MSDLWQSNLVDDPSYDYYKFLWRKYRRRLTGDSGRVTVKLKSETIL